MTPTETAPPLALSLSGGKDSAATACYLRDQGIPFQAVFMDTGWEHSATYHYIDTELEPRFGPIVRLSGLIELPEVLEAQAVAIEALMGHQSAMVRWVLKKGMFPSRMRRYCTSELKVIPFLAWASAHGVEENAVGIRAAESKARAHLAEREPMPGAGWLEVWRPILRWSEADVIAAHRRFELPPNPLYLMGASRVGCWPCIMSRKKEISMIADNDPNRIEVMRRLEAAVGVAAGLRRPDIENGPTWFQAPMGGREPGDRPCWPIDKVIAWSKTAHGGRQFELFAPTDTEAGCVRWGMCDTGTEAPDPTPLRRPL